MTLDPWQEEVLDVAMAEAANGKWAAFDFGLCVPRRNGKTEIVVARILAGLFLLDERLQVYSAHQFKTAMDTYNRLRGIVEANPDLRRRVRAMPDANGKEGIYFHGEHAARVMITARGKNAVRGFGADAVYFDEAMDLPETAVSAMIPALSSEPNGQAWYLGSAVDQDVHEHGEVFARKRRSAVARESGRLAYMEYSSPGTIDAHDAWDEAAIRAGNPAIDLHFFDMDAVDAERGSMSRRGFAVERMGIGDWPAPEVQHDSVIPRETWDALAEAGSEFLGDVAFAVDVSPNRTKATIAAAGLTEDGHLQVELVAHGEGTAWLPSRIVGLVLQWNPVAVVCDKLAVGSLADSLVDDGIEMTLTSSTEMALACGGFYDDAESAVLAHLNDPILNDALLDATTRKLESAWAWDRRGKAQITPLVAVTLARYGFVKFRPAPKRQGPGPQALKTATTTTTRTDDLATAGF